jgi:hypothetical protein
MHEINTPDIAMPVMDGIGTPEELKGEPALNMIFTPSCRWLGRAEKT